MKRIILATLAGLAVCGSVSAWGEGYYSPPINTVEHRSNNVFMMNSNNGGTGTVSANDPLVIGPARVIDGDTLQINNIHVRLYGIDAPEKTQMCDNDRVKDGLWNMCGMKSIEMMVSLVKGKIVTCTAVPGQRDKYSRMIGKCSTPDTSDLGDRMVRSGQALAYRKYSMDYVAAEDEAHERKLGIWASKFVYPWDYRRGVR